MESRLGIARLLPLVELAGEAVNVIHKLSNKAGILVLLSLTDEASAIGGLDFNQVWLEIKDLDAAEGKMLNDAFKGKISLSDKALEAKLEGGGDLLEKSLKLAFEAKALVDKGISLVAEGKDLLS